MPSILAPRRTGSHRPALAWFCFFALAWTTCLLYAGGFTTSIEAGMAFLDWPLSNGSINPDGWLTESDKMAEHSHRLLGAIVGALTITIAVWTFLSDARGWIRKLAWTAFGLVVFQGVLGGLRVVFDRLNTGGEGNLAAQTFRVLHACTAQIFLCQLMAIAVAMTRRWIEQNAGLQRPPSADLRRAGLLACVAIFAQLVFGALMRHNQAGLAIPYFPHATAEGAWLPAFWSGQAGIHFLHRVWAVVVVIALVNFAGRLWASRHTGLVLGAGAVVLMALLSLQIYLGALVIWTLRNPHAATVHMLAGAFLLACTWGLTFALHRFSIDQPPAVAASASSRPGRTPAVAP